MDLDKGSDELLSQADVLAHSYHAKLSVCPVLSEICPIDLSHIAFAKQSGALEIAALNLR